MERKKNGSPNSDPREVKCNIRRLDEHSIKKKEKEKENQTPKMTNSDIYRQ
jgi:hypothetical protein